MKTPLYDGWKTTGSWKTAAAGEDNAMQIDEEQIMQIDDGNGW